MLVKDSPTKPAWETTLFLLRVKGFLSKMVKVSVIIPVYNCVDFIEECLQSILNQEDLTLPSTGEGEEVIIRVEISIYEDGSTDGTVKVIEDLIKGGKYGENFTVLMERNGGGSPRGVGHGRNVAIRKSSGEYLCFCDADDIMEPTRIKEQYLLASENRDALIGTKFRRTPPNSTTNFTYWANNLREDQLTTQIYTSFGPTIIMPTWFCHRSVYERVPPPGFDESGKGTPEDLLFFYKHLDGGGRVLRVPDKVLMVYRYHPSATTFSVKDETIWSIRLSRLESHVLQGWDRFTIWNAGKSGRRLFRSLGEVNRGKVQAFCDVDAKKLRQKFYEPFPLKYKVPIVPPQEARPPFLICVKTELIWEADGPFRKLLDSFSLTEGVDFVYFN